MSTSPRKSPAPIPILVYHSVSADPAPWIAPYTVSASVLRSHLDRIVERGLHTLQISELTEMLDSHEPLAAGSLCITIDDGFADSLGTVGPEIAERGLSATLFVTTGALRDGPVGSRSRLGESPMLHWSDLPDLEQLGIEIGSHSETHPPLDVVEGSLLARELSLSKQKLEDFLGHGVRSFAYPHGFYDRRAVAAVAEAGYDSAVAVRNAFSSAADDRFSRARLMIRADTPFHLVDAWLSGVGAPVAPFPVRLRTRVWRLRRRVSELAYTRAGEWKGS